LLDSLLQEKNVEDFEEWCADRQQIVKPFSEQEFEC